MRKYVPSSVPYKPIENIQGAFASWTPGKGREVDHPQLISGFSALVASFPAQKQLSFIDTHEDAQRFPFEAFAHKHHDVFADLVISFPGQRLAESAHPKLSDIAMILMVKAEREDDPFKSDRLKRCKTIVQLAAHARNLMHAHGLTSAFVLGIYGDLLRICRCDHSGVVVSQPINLTDADGLEIMQEFFWRFVHPAEDVPFVGWDPTVRKLTSADQEWLKARLDLANFDTKGALPFTEARRAEIFDDGSGGVAVDPRAYILFKAINVNGRLFSRGTTVWLGICDTRISLDGCVVDPPGNVSPEDLKVRVIKDTWRELGRRPETEFYRRLSTVPHSERVGLPSLICGGDLGEKEVRDWETALYGAPSPAPLNADHHQSRLARPASLPDSSYSPPTSLSISTSSRELPAHHPIQQTFTWRQVRGPEYWHRERSHMRFVVGEVGRPITQFKSTRELATAFRDAIIGEFGSNHDAVFLVVTPDSDFQDIAMRVGNILIVDDPDGQEQFCGFIHDFDHSYMTRGVPQGDMSSLSATALTEFLTADDVAGQLKERTGTFLFMSHELLDLDEPVVHDVRHDLHSFYWVLLWVVLRHTKHNMPGGIRVRGMGTPDACTRVFKQSDSSDAANAKLSWLFTSKSPVITGNDPLTMLMKEFGALVRKSVSESESPSPTTTLDYDAVLDVFGRALARQDWPTSEDSPVPYVPPTWHPIKGWVFEDAPPKPHARVHRHGKRAEVASESDSGNEIDEDDFDEAYESSDDGQPVPCSSGDPRDDEVAPSGHDGLARSCMVSSLYSVERLGIGMDEGDADELEDAAEVSALIGYRDDDD
ncbi:hypothetical protein GSI_09777 [Ganoderma sinense ZZ0214-1]|uniref:Fungal-type protein kinase domain-containing protein n=1 Tax=Ganoderma sinense ZZ0214-1 TaxID=1077348 RepID=A0A2G8S2X8_9APHY|nr:hypothetical protein GSI_09777 [Ganoderma sinense ZZ0214-1]